MHAYTSHHILGILLHYLVKYDCQKTSDNLKNVKGSIFHLALSMLLHYLAKCQKTSDNLRNVKTVRIPPRLEHAATLPCEI